MVPKKFTLDLGWRVLLKDLGIAPADLLRQADLPGDLLARQAPMLAVDEYFRFCEALGKLLDDPAFPLRIGQAVSVEAFSPPIFAACCSPDLNAALERLSQYKPLIGPLSLDVTVGSQETRAILGGLSGEQQPPPALMATELVFLVHLARLATRERIVPVAVHVKAPLAEADAYADFFGVPVTLGSYDGIAFSAEDARRPFMTASDSLWAVFEPELRARLGDLGIEAGFRDRVRACLNEMLAGGRCTMTDVARRLAVSTRTLQRRLHDEGTSFQQELNSLREELARHYLANSHYSGAEISFLLGYNDPNSFIRAFHTWTGQTPEAARPQSRLQ
ncbi:AraC family transcriptional regulator ligand-binding domain-containing protein [Bauldia sp.]|uniref:AraC family transcriptional regulator n=1 Tax=Bauldia sp. TaxID=2575872 RepID=UPI003BAAC76B